jgi:hypothetical protein
MLRRGAALMCAACVFGGARRRWPPIGPADRLTDEKATPAHESLARVELESLKASSGGRLELVQVGAQ